MGIISFSIPKNLVLAIQQQAVIDNFVETGTFKGGTSFWAAQYFNKIYTIEIDEQISKETASRPDRPNNIEFIIGDSRDEIGKLVGKLKGSSFFWLDGHWCSGAGGKDDECPLIDELKSIAICNDPVIFIDDARCFLGPLPPPHNYDDWPMVDEIFALIKELFPRHFTTIIDDVIIAVPAHIRPVVYKYWMDTFNERFSQSQEIVYAPQQSLLERGLRKGYHLLKGTPKNNEVSIDPVEQARQDLIKQNKWLIDLNIASILDIGANTGQFAKKIRTILPAAKIYSFEPIPVVFEGLKTNFKNDRNFEAYNIALGENEGMTSFFLNEFSDSSSLLKMNETHKKNFPFTEKESEIKVNVKRLDDVISCEKISKPYLIKLDVQGFEEKVINGGQKVIENADYIISEVSFVELYNGQPLFETIYEKMKKMGFQYIGNWDQLKSPMNGEILQADAIFKKIK